MFKTLTLSVAILATSLTASAVELTNNSEVGPCTTTECNLVDAGISFVGRVTDSASGEVLILLLADMEDRSVACEIAGNDEILFLTGVGTFEGC